MLLAASIVAVPGHGQDWHAGTDLPLVRRAAERRAVRDADSALVTWRAKAHGVVRFAVLFGHQGDPVERVVSADELQVEVYGEAPNRSKQVITAWRDTTLLPYRERYHRDHLGIVANDFGGVIRIGEGEEVRDVPHPLSAAGLTQYLFAVRDTLLLTSSSGTVRVVRVDVRPASHGMAGVVGSLYLDLDRAELVRMVCTFSAESYRDPTVEAISMVLENSLVERQRWLPWQQSLAIRRRARWVDLPFRTVIRADWTIDDYQLGIPVAADRFLGPPVDGLRRPSDSGAWNAPLSTRLEALPADEIDLPDVQREMAGIVGQRVLEGLARWRPSGLGGGGLLHANRVQGVTPGLGARFGAESGIHLNLHAEYGFSDHRLNGGLRLEQTTRPVGWWLEAGRQVVDPADEPLASRIANTFALIGGGSDYGDYVRLDQVQGGIGLGLGAHDRITASIAWESSHDAPTSFRPLWGSPRPNPPLAAGDVGVARLSLSHRNRLGEGWTVLAEAGRGDADWQRLEFRGRAVTPVGSGRVTLDVHGGLGSPDLPGYRAWALGGRGTLPGIRFRESGGRRLAWGELSWMRPLNLPTPPLPIIGRVPLPSWIGPMVAVGAVGGSLARTPWPEDPGVKVVLGARAEFWGPVLRIDLGYAPQRGRLALLVDLHPDWWGLF